MRDGTPGLYREFDAFVAASLESQCDGNKRAPPVNLGEFEFFVLSASMRLGDEAYGASVGREIEAATGRSCSIGALYTTLERLEAKGLVQTRMGESTPQRGGRPKRMIRVTAAGRRSAAAFYQAVQRVTDGVAWVTK